jgi:hypothetical protein
MMDADEKEIYRYLKNQAGGGVTASNISRHAGGKRRFQDEPDWARSPLLRMEERGIIQRDAAGAYQLRPVPKDLGNSAKWVSPQIAEILARSGRKFDVKASNATDGEAYYDSL